VSVPTVRSASWSGIASVRYCLAAILIPLNR
jgi:hypothetical protein